MDIEKEVLDILSYYAGEDKVRMDDNIKDGLRLDSLDCVEAIMDIEKVFGITIPDEEAERCLTARDAVGLVERKMKEARL